MSDSEGLHYCFDQDRVVDSSGKPWVDAPVDGDRFLASMARYMIEGDERDEARHLLGCTLSSSDWTDDSGFETYEGLNLTFHGPRRVYELLGDESTNAYKAFHGAASAVAPERYDTIQIKARAAIVAVDSADWRNELLAVLDGRDVDNQAIGFKATVSYQGLRFRSESEVRVAQALDRAGVMYLPNCKARVGNPTDRRRNSEADFLVMHEGKWGVLEVDGTQWHTGTAARDHTKDRAFLFHGARIAQRYDAGECFENPDAVVKQFLALLRTK